MRRWLLIGLLMAGCGRDPIERREWPVMGTIAAVQWSGRVDGGRVQEVVQGVFGELNALLDAHVPSSELSRLAALADDEVMARCDVQVRDCYQAAFRLRDETGWRFNPRYRGTNTMDLGAIAKGFAVDVAARRLTEAGLITAGGRVLIDLGGNLKAVGGDWKVGIEHESTAFTLEDGAACATSATYHRGNHIMDGRTGREIEGKTASVTVVHPSSAMLADGLSTVMFLLGPIEGESFLEAHYPAAKAFWSHQ